MCHKVSAKKLVRLRAEDHSKWKSTQHRRKHHVDHASAASSTQAFGTPAHPHRLGIVMIVAEPACLDVADCEVAN